LQILSSILIARNALAKTTTQSTRMALGIVLDVGSRSYLKNSRKQMKVVTVSAKLKLTQRKIWKTKQRLALNQ